MMASARASIWGAALDGDVVGEVQRPDSERDRDDRLRQRAGDVVERRGRRSNDGRTHRLDQRNGRGQVETVALVVDRCRRHAGLDQLDPATVHDLVFA